MDQEDITFLFNLATSISASFIYDISKKVVKLLPHQESNLTKWKEFWNPSPEDLELIKNDKDIQRIVSILFEKAENEIFEEKLANWGKITDNVVRNKKTDNSHDLYFIKLFSDMPLSVLYYLLNLYKKGEAEVINGYPVNDSEKQEEYFCSNYCVCLSLTECYSGKFKLTDLGKSFIDFIGDKYQSIN